MTKEKELAQQILTLTGGAENIANAAHCMTRLRLTLHDKSKSDAVAIKALPGVLGVVVAEEQLQIILGPGFVNKVAAATTAILDSAQREIPPEVSETSHAMEALPSDKSQPPLTAQALKEKITAKNKTPFKLFLRKIASIFVPLIPAIVASGMVAGLTNIAIQAGCDPKSSVISMLNVIGWGLFSYLGIFVGINTAKEFGGTPALGGLAGILIMNPAIATLTVYGEALVPGRGGLIGVLLAAAFMAFTEKKLRPYIPHALDIVATPLLSLLITSFAVFYVLQPIGGLLSDGIIAFFKIILQSGGPFAGFALAGTFLPVVMTGLHQGLLPIHMEFLNVQKANPLMPILAMAGAGQVGAACAIYIKTKNDKLKTIIQGALPVGVLGIGEPLIFGVTLPLGRPFFTACLGAGCGGAFQATMQVQSIALGLSGLPLTFLIEPQSIMYYLIGLVLAYFFGFLFTYLAGFDEEKVKTI
ncbi:MAG: PTS transporter subunit EIIC [Sporomusaceae bacterium]|nr:PTS transporter subunit EIIC [Sporomusaceae bacterium]